MKYIRTALFIILLPALFLFVDYVLPKNEIVRVNDTYSRITDIGMNAMFYAQEDVVAGADAAGQTRRDIRFISAVTPEGNVRVYRNEDTGWVYPPYFKYDSANLQAEAAALVSNEDTPKWAMTTSYGWRIAWLSIYPNAVSVKRVESTDVSTINVVGLAVLLFMFWTVQFLNRGYHRLMRRSVDPTLADLDARADAFRAGVVAGAEERTRGTRQWLGTWKGKPRPPKT